jgi:hypothetical protein
VFAMALFCFALDSLKHLNESGSWWSFQNLDESEGHVAYAWFS